MCVFSKLKSLAVCAALLVAATTYASAQSSGAPGGTKPLDAISIALSNMGYTPTVSGDYATIAEGNNTLTFSLSNDKATVFLAASRPVPADKASKVPAIKLLSFNDTHTSAAYVHMNDQGVITLVGLALAFPSTDVSAKQLRAEINIITGDAGASQALLNPSNW